MSNYAPDPANEEIYNNLQNKTLSSVSAEDIQKLTDPTFLQSTNQDAIITYNIVNEAAMRDGQPMPGTSIIIRAQCTDSGVAVEVKAPQPGEVWVIQSASATITGRSGSIAHELIFTDQNNSRSFSWFYYGASSSGPLIFSTDADWFNRTTFDANQVLTYEATGTFDDSFLDILLYRIR